MGRRLWLLLLVALIIILYCISWRPAYCQLPDTVEIHDSPENYVPPHAAENTAQRETETTRQIPRPQAENLRPFGYEIFSENAPSFDAVNQSIAPDDYRLGAGDQLLLNTWGRVDLNIELIVDREGKVSIPRAGEVTVHGQTLSEAKDRIRRKLQTIYSDFELSLFLGRLRSMTVFAVGEVRRPGAYTVSSLTTVFNALYQAGGPNERGSLRQVRLMRGNRQVEEIDFYDLMLSGRRGSDPRLQPGDIIFVPVVGPRVAVRGEIKRPAIYELRNNERLTDLFALAGGPTAEAYLARVMIDRVAEHDGRLLLDVDYTAALTDKSTDVILADGDDVSVFSIFDSRPNTVWLEGAVRRPGAFERTPGMTVYDLIDGGDRLTGEAFVGRADLERSDDDGTIELIPVAIGDLCDGEGELDFTLQDGDRLIVYDRERVLRKSKVQIDGLVEQPGEYDLLRSMRLSDLIFRAGGLGKNAFLARAEIARRHPDGSRKILTVDLGDILIRHDLEEDIILREDDHVFIRENPESLGFPMVTLEWAVLFPGRFALLEPTDGLYELIDRAGGLTPRAFPQGTLFIRQKISDDLKRQNLSQVLAHSEPIVQDSSGSFIRQQLLRFDPEEMTRIVLDVPSILSNQGGEEDIILQDGDHIFVPEVPSGIQLMGAIASPGTIKYHSNWKVGRYLEEAGGVTSAANKKEMRLIRANGRVISGENILGRKAKLGDAIFVASRIKKEKNWLPYLTGTASVLASVATTWLLIDRIGE